MKMDLMDFKQGSVIKYTCRPTSYIQIQINRNKPCRSCFFRSSCQNARVKLEWRLKTAYLLIVYSQLKLTKFWWKLWIWKSLFLCRHVNELKWHKSQDTYSLKFFTFTNSLNFFTLLVLKLVMCKVLKSIPNNWNVLSRLKIILRGHLTTILSGILGCKSLWDCPFSRKNCWSLCDLDSF